ncbi:MAG: pseudouridine synthase [Bacteroidia bacterium]|jgi:23S rRNA pseudouridine2457 synthase
MHYLLHKPYGYLSQFVCDVKKKKLLGDLYAFAPGTMAIGRLDEDSEGLLLLTEDGRLSERIRGREMEKEYHVQVDGLITVEAIQQLRNGVEIGIKGSKYQTLPCMVNAIQDPGYALRSRKIRDDRHGPTSWVSVTLTEGKLRQVRKMIAAVGFPALRLIRVRIGQLQLGDLKVGEVREAVDLEKLLYYNTQQL